MFGQKTDNNQSNRMDIQALKLITSTASKSQNLKQQSNKLRTNCIENQMTAEELDISLSIHDKTSKKIEEKKAELLSKQKQLIELQKVCIDLIQNPLPEKPVDLSKYLIIVTVMTKIQETITNLTANAVDNNSIAINITDIFPIIESFNQIFNTLESNQIIHETPEEKEKRSGLISQLQDIILPKLQNLLGSLEEEDFLEEEEDLADVENVEENEEQTPKVVVVEEKPVQEVTNDTKVEQTNDSEAKQDNDQKVDSNTNNTNPNNENVPNETEPKQ